MCFGESETQKTETQTSQFPSWLSQAGQQNLNFAQDLQSKGFTPYTGQQVADFSPQQAQSFGMGSDVANAVMPQVGQAGQLVSDYANGPASQTWSDPIYSRMSPYMNQYVMQALAPQLQAQDQQFAQQNKSFDSAATGSGAFGDTSWGLGRTNLTNEQNIGRMGLIGNAYNNAFNTAIGAGAQDVANAMNARTTNASLNEQALARKLQGGTTLANLGTGVTNLVNQLGGQQTAQGQAGLNAKYNQWMMAQQYPFQTTQLVNQGIASAAGVNPANVTKTTAAPDNSGYGIIGSLAGDALTAIPFLADGGHTEGPAVVGERGPELFVPNTSGVVIPNEVLEAARLLRDFKLKGGDLSLTQFGIAA